MSRNSTSGGAAVLFVGVQAVAAHPTRRGFGPGGRRPDPAGTRSVILGLQQSWRGDLGDCRRRVRFPEAALLVLERLVEASRFSAGGAGVGEPRRKVHLAGDERSTGWRLRPKEDSTSLVISAILARRTRYRGPRTPATTPTRLEQHHGVVAERLGVFRVTTSRVQVDVVGGLGERT